MKAPSLRTGEDKPKKPVKKQPNPSLANWDGMVQKADGSVGMWGNPLKGLTPRGARLYPKGNLTGDDINYLKSLSDSKVNEALERNVSRKAEVALYGAMDSDLFKGLLSKREKPNLLAGVPKMKLGGFIEGNVDPLNTAVNFTADAAGMFARKNKANVGLSTGQGLLKGAGMGAKFGANFGPQGALIGAGVGAVAGGITSLIGANKRKDEMEEQEAAMLEQNKNAAIASSANTLADFPVNGVQGVQYYKLGGSIMKAPNFATGGQAEGQYEVEEGEVVQGNPTLEDSKQLASDMHLVKGEKHSEGGVQGQGGERVYSDKTKLPSFVRELLKDNKIKTKASDTYAEVAKKLGEKKGKLEVKLASNHTPAINTAKLGGERITALLDGIFEIQEITKPKTEQDKFALGGKLPKTYEEIVAFQNYAQNNGFNFGNSGVNAKGKGVFGPTTTKAYAQLGSQYETENSLVAKSAPLIQTVGSPALPKTLLHYKVPSMPSTETATQPNFVNKALGFIGENEGELMNAGSYLANLGSINKLDTNVTPGFMSAPKFNYTDRSGIEVDSNERNFRTAAQIAQGTSGGAAKIGAMYAETLDARSKIANTENKRRDDYVNNFNQRSDRVSAMNTQIGNEANAERRDLFNAKNVTLPQQARTAFLEGVMGNKAMKGAKALDEKKAVLSAMVNDENGTITNLSKKLGYKDTADFINKFIMNKKNGK